MTFLGFGLESKLSDSQFSKCSESHQQGTGLGTIITFALFAICYKDFFDCFETYPALRAPLSERGGCRITTIFETIGYILNGVIFLSRGYIEGERAGAIIMCASPFSINVTSELTEDMLYKHNQLICRVL